MTDQQLTDRLHRLPWLAQQASQPDLQRAARMSRAIVGHALPRAVLDVIDELDRGREHPSLLAQLGRCVRNVCEQYDRRLLPDLLPEGLETWQSETAWLIETQPVWDPAPTDDDPEPDRWCYHWINTHTESIERQLTRKAEAATPETIPTACDACGHPLTVTETALLQIAECPECERVAGMREIEGQPIPILAPLVGRPARALQRWAVAGLLKPVSRHKPTKARPALYRLADVQRLARMIRTTNTDEAAS